MKSIKIFDKNWYPALMQYQMGLHIVNSFLVVLIIACIVIKGVHCKGDWWGLVLGISFILVTELSFSVLPAFDDKLAEFVDKNGWGGADYGD